MQYTIAMLSFSLISLCLPTRAYWRQCKNLEPSTYRPAQYRISKEQQSKVLPPTPSRDTGASRRQVLKKEFFEVREATEYIYANIPEVIFSVDDSRKRIIGLDFERYFYYIIATQSCEQAWF